METLLQTPGREEQVVANHLEMPGAPGRGVPMLSPSCHCGSSELTGENRQPAAGPRSLALQRLVNTHNPPP